MPIIQSIKKNLMSAFVILISVLKCMIAKAQFVVNHSNLIGTLRTSVNKGSMIGLIFLLVTVLSSLNAKSVPITDLSNIEVTLDKSVPRGFNNLNSEVSLASLSSASMMTSPSGYIKFADLRGVVGAPQFDDLSVCGSCDTISIFVVTNSNDPITDNVLTVNLPDGLKYCGQVGSQTTIGVSEANVSDIYAPQFSIPDINSGNGVQVWFTVSADCDALTTLFDDEDDQLNIDYRMDYTDPLGQAAYDLFFPPRSYNNGIKIPVINILSVENQTLAGAPINSTLSLPNTYKQKVTISQNGIGAYLEEFYLEVDYDELAYSYASMTINGIDVSTKVIDNGDLLQVLIDGIDFANNMDTLLDVDLFEEEEELMLEVVWDVDYCLDANLEVTYSAYYSCGGSICRENTDDSRTSVTAVDGVEYNVTYTPAGTHGTTSMCNDRTRTLLFRNLSTASSADIYDIGFESSSTNLCDFVDITVNGVSVLEGFGVSPANLNRSAISLADLLLEDPDGAGVGLEDLDNDGYYDDLENSTSVSIVFTIQSVCNEFDEYRELTTSCIRVNCNYRPYFRVIYRTACQEGYNSGNSYTEAWRIQSQTLRNLGITSHPPNLSQNQSFNLDYTVDFSNNYLSPSSSCSNYSLAYALPLSSGFQINSASWGGSAIHSDSITIVNDTLFIRTHGINRTNLTTNTVLRVNMTNLICINDVVEWKPITYLNCDDDLPDCGCRVAINNTPEGQSCASSDNTIRLGCTCPWINTTQYDVSRISYGYTDKSMTASVDENTSGLSLNNFLACDSFYISTEGVVRGDGYDSLKLHIGQNSTQFMLDNITAEFEVVDVSTGMTISGVCGSITKNLDDDQVSFQDPFVFRTIYGYEFDLSACLTQPLDVGDTVRLTGYGTIKSSGLTTSQSPTINEAYWSVYDTSAEFMDFMPCNALNDPIGTYIYKMHGTGSVDFNNFCEGTFTGLITPGTSIYQTSNTNAFPNEYRIVNNLDSIVIYSEGEVDESSFMLQISDSGLMPVLASRTFQSGNYTAYVFTIDDMSYPSVCTDYAASGDTLGLFSFNYFRNCSANDVSRTDVGVYYRTYYRSNGNLDNDPECYINSNDVTNGTNEISIGTPPPGAPALDLMVSPLFQTASSGSICFDVTIENVGVSVAPLTWIGLENISGDVDFISATRNSGTVILEILPSGDAMDNQVLIDLDTMLGNDQLVDIEICINATSCGLDTVGFYAGWECDLLPLDIETGNYGVYSCLPVYQSATFEILDPQLQLDFISPETGVVSYCEETEFILEIKNVRQGPAFVDSLFLYMPLGTGFQFVPGSFTGEWPLGGTPVSIPDPVATGVSDLFMGNQYVLTNFAPPLDANQTLPGIDIDPNLSRMYISFDAIATCSYEDASLMQFQAAGTNICGEKVMSNLNTSPRISLFGLDTAIVNEYLIFLEPTQFATCSDQEIFEINILNNGPFPTSPDELVCITIPNTVPLVSGSFDFINPGIWNPSIEVDSVGPGIKQYCFHMPAGVPDGGVFTFNFEVDVDANTPCGIYPFYIKTLFENGTICDYFESEEECNLSISTSLNTEFGVNLISSLTASEINTDLELEVCGELGTPQVTYSMLAQNNNLVEDFPSGQASVRLYDDVDGNGVLDFGTDLLIESQFINEVIPAGGNVMVSGMFDLPLSEYCDNQGYIIELSDNAGCACGSEYTPINPEIKGLLGPSSDETQYLCEDYFEFYPEFECDTYSGLYAAIAGETNTDNYYYTYFQLPLASLTDGAGNALDPADYFDESPMMYMEMEGDSTYTYVYSELYGDILQCSEDGVLKLTYDIPYNSISGCSLPYTLTLDCSGSALNFNSSVSADPVFCEVGDSICVNLFDHLLFEDADGNSIDPYDPDSGFEVSNFPYIYIYKIENGTIFQAYFNGAADSISTYEDLDYEVCVADGDAYRVSFYSNSSSCTSPTAYVQFGLGGADTTFMYGLAYPTEICLGEEAIIENSHTGLFQGISVVSGDQLAIPICNNLDVCDTIRVSPSIETTYLISLTDSLGCPKDTMITIGVRNTESPLVITVDDNLLCDNSAETAMVCIDDSRAASIFSWQRNGVDIPGSMGQTCITVSMSGVYSVTAEDDIGCSLAGMNSVFIQPSPEPLALLYGDSTFCVGVDTLTIATTTGYEAYTWYQISGGMTTQIASDVNSLIFSDAGTHSFFVEVTDLQGCLGASDTITVTGQDCYVDLELDKALLYNGVDAPDTLRLCDTITYMITIENRTMQVDTLPLDATNVVVKDSLPIGLSYIGYQSTKGTFDPISGDWDIGFLRNGRADTLWIDSKIDSAIYIYNFAEVTGHSEPDIDSEPDNKGPTPQEDDEADEMVAVEIVDMALTKTVYTPGPYAVGDTIDFEIVVYNQGNITMDSIVVNDYVPSGYTFDASGENSEWTMINDSLYQTELTGGIPFGANDTVYISLVINPVSADVDQYLNISELHSFQNENGEDRTMDDIDSEADDDPDNDAGGEEGSDADDTVDGDGSGDGGPADPLTDEDDQDPARIDVVDFALTKRVSAPMAPFSVGDTITFDITIYNQGTVTGENFVIYDHAPIGFTYVQSLNASEGWLEGAGMDPDSALYTGPLAPMESDVIQLQLIVNDMGVGLEDYTNYAEIGSVEDEEGNDISDEDQDSTPDDDPTDDAGGEPDGESDDEVDGDGSGDSDSDDPMTDEDDHDPAIVEIVDMALTKTVVTEGPYAVGDTIQFEIVVYNQGNIAMDSIVVNDYVPSGYTFDASGVNSEWAMINDSLYQTTLTGGIIAKATDTTYISLVINPVGADADQYLNISELSSFQDEGGDDRTMDDEDSDADDTPDNDGGGEEGSDADDTVDGDGTGEGGPADPLTDEDDQDPARIEIFDLALIKTLNTDSTITPIMPGSTVVFDLTVYNQGTVHARDVQISDYIPAGLSLMDDDWFTIGDTARLKVAIGFLGARDSITVPIGFTVNDDFMGESITNNAEIESHNDGSGAPREDVDSTPGNEDGTVPDDNDNDIDETMGEDDYDLAMISIRQTFDLALKKVLAESGPFVPGDIVTYTITVYNQGTLDATDVVVRDYVPSNMTNVDPEWLGVDTFLLGDIVSGDSASVDIDLEISPMFMDTVLTNNAEIIGADNELNYPDEDSDPTTPNSSIDNTDEVDTDNDIDDDGYGTPGSEDNDMDEDDVDPVQIEVEQTFDLALKKELAESGPFVPGDTVTYTITVYNQGTLDATDVVVRDYVPSNMTNVDPEWLGVDTFLLGDIAFGDSSSVDIDLEISPMFMDTVLTNNAEIIGADNELDYPDEDSDPTTPNSSIDNTDEVDTDDDIDDDGAGTPGIEDNDMDEDDVDPVQIEVEQTFDLALKKVLAERGPFVPGDTVTYTITVYNQGTLDATDVVVRDYVPSNMTNVDPEWLGVDTFLLGDIAFGDSSSVDIDLEISPMFMDTVLTNNAEIIGSDNELDYPDEDSDPTTPNSSIDNTDEVDTDNDIDDDGAGTPGSEDNNMDEDDVDPVQIEVEQTFDLALKKVLAESGPFVPGDTVTYTITVYNQGTLDATDVVVRDYVPSNMTNVDPEWLGIDTFLLGDIVSGDSASVDIDLEISPMFMDTVLTNNAEIIGADNELNYPDEDSDPTTPNSSIDNTDEVDTDNDIDDDGAGTPGSEDNNMDEDDVDPVQIEVEQTFDLALKKVLAESGPFVPGDTVTYTITVYNQGTLDATDVVVRDYVPSNMTNVDPEWLGVDTFLLGDIAFGDSSSVDIDLEISPMFMGTVLTNNAEIIGSDNELDYPDEDSDPTTPNSSIDNTDEVDTDNDIDDDGAGTPGSEDNNMDEDDVDPVQIEVEQTFDLALKKVLAESGPFVPGDTVTYTITVYNQGTLDATDVVVRDYVPSNMTNVDPEWLGVDTFLLGDIVSGDSASVDIDLEISPMFMDTVLTNNAEITGADNELGYPDEDSDPTTPNSSIDNTDEVDTDDDIDDDGAGTPGIEDNDMDEDDVDPVQIEVEQTFDLALKKVLAESGPFVPGDTVTYTITVYNQGTLDVTNVVVRDYVPSNMTNVDPEWLGVDTFLLGDIAFGDSASVDIDLEISPMFMDTVLTNNAEIIGADNELDYPDEDSDPTTPNSSIDNTDEVDTDDDIDDDGAGTPGIEDNDMDEDDVDPVQIEVEQTFDLALKKVLAESGPFVPGDTVTYTITVYNQGTLDATNVVVRDYVPSNMTNVDPEWLGVDTFLLGDIAFGDSASVDIDLEISPMFMDTVLTNNAEIIGADNELDYPDEDSDPTTPNSSIDNTDEVDTDDDTDDDGAGTPGIEDNDMDEDDVDPVQIEVEQTFDLALKKELAENGPFVPGDTVTYTITVYNQGTLDATDVVVRDYVPSNMTNVDPEWLGVDTFLLGDIVSGDSSSVDIDLEISPMFIGTTLTNNAEITGADNELDYPDEDSDSTTPNSSVDNTDEVDTDNDIDDDGDGTPGIEDNDMDEDDVDPVQITVGQTFDLALKKVLAESGPFVPGDTVTYTITVYNQGTLEATDVVVRDYVPSNMTNVDPEWLGVDTFLLGDIVSGDSASVDIDLEISPMFMGTVMTNNAEIIGAYNELDYPDEDSDPTIPNSSIDNTDEVDTDDDIDDDGAGTPGIEDNDMDEDDVDPVQIEVEQTFDLALKKELCKTGPFAPGDTVTFTITVYNQGTLDATDVVVRDYVPSSMTNVDPEWLGVDTFLLGDIVSGDSASVDIDLKISPMFMGTVMTNNAEITGADNELDYPDEDSDPTKPNISVDDTEEVDTDDDIDDDGDGTPGSEDNDMDEDDVDPVQFEVVQTFDLALKKVLSEPGPFAPGDTVTFTITVYNQGTLDATDVVVRDYVPSNMTNVDPEWLGVDTFLLGDIVSGDSASVDIDLEISPMFMGTVMTNNAEITGADNELDYPDEDSDLTTPNSSVDDTEEVDTDDDIDDDGHGTPGIEDNDMDEDDVDPVQFEVIQTFDLALKKALSEPGPFVPGDTVTFTITVYNQGTLDAMNVVVRDYVPSNMTNVDPDWSSDTYAIGSVASGDSASIDIDLEISPMFMGTVMTNNAEITGADNELDYPDEDSDLTTPNISVDDTEEVDTDDDIDDDGDGTPGIEDNDMDEDDVDPVQFEVVQTFDLALKKVLSEPGPFVPGDTVTFTITVYNQGTLDATDVVVRDYVPSSMTNVDLDWSGDTYAIGSVASGDSASIDIDLEISPMFMGTVMTNNAEITGADNELDYPDEDSDPTTPNSSVDDTEEVDTDDDINDDGEGTPGIEDNDMDEDDVDPVQFEVVQIFDLALKKELAESGPFVPGDSVTFTITVYNQGTLDATNVVVRDYVPSNMTNVDPDWSGDTYAIGSVASGDSASIDIDLEISPMFMGTVMTNNAEITGADNELDYPDEDSDLTTPNSSVDDTEEVDTDDDIDDDGAGTPGIEDNDMDEDDVDPVQFEVVQTFDLALAKKLNSGTDSPIVPGSTVIFDLEVFNQGTVDAYDIQLSDYVPSGLTLTPSSVWEMNGDTANLVTPIARLDAGQSTIVQIRFTVDEGFMETSITNNAEIESQEDIDGPREDEDSNAGDEDGTMPDEEEDNDNITEINGDDDYDFEVIEIVQIFDLSIMKDIVTEGPYVPGQDIEFQMTVCNVGTLDARSFEVTDYVPAGMSLTDSDTNDGWIMTGENTYVYEYNQTLPALNPDSCIIIPILLTLDDSFNGGSITNNAEIIESEGDQMDENEDNDSDDEMFILFDVALTKIVNEDLTPGQLYQGSPVSYDITVYNQGTVSAFDVRVEDYFDPTELVFIDMILPTNAVSGNAVTAEQSGSTFMLDSLSAGDQVIVTLNFTVHPMATNSMIVNNAEITFASASIGGLLALDEDSPLSDINNGSTNELSTDNEISDNIIPGQIDSQIDQDDYDPALIDVNLCLPQIYACPTDWNMTIGVGDVCNVVEGMNIGTLLSSTNIDFEDCGDASLFTSTYADSLVREDCTGGLSFDSRTVFRTYSISNVQTGEVIEVCPQEITFEIDGCQSLTDFGGISIDGDVRLTVGPGCELPLIEVSQVEQGVCGYVEYMWLTTTESNPDGSPITPTEFNIGTVWKLMDGEFAATLQPESVSQNTYYVRCARNFSCCDFGESNVVSVIVEDGASCPGLTNPGIVLRQDCDSTFVLTSPTDDIVNGEQMMYITNETIDAENKTMNEASLMLDAKEGVIMKAGFEVENNAQLEVQTKGCND